MLHHGQCSYTQAVSYLGLNPHPEVNFTDTYVCVCVYIKLTGWYWAMKTEDMIKNSRVLLALEVPPLLGMLR